MPKLSMKPLALGAALLISGCAAGPDFLRPASPLPEQYQASTRVTEPGPSTANAAEGERTAADNAAPQINPHWWTLFQDPELDQLMQLALANNQNLMAAIARMEAAEAAAREAGAERFPSVDVSGGSIRSRSSGATANGQRMGAMTSTNRRAALDIQYELDLWGRIRRSNEAARAEALASRHARDAVRLSLSGQVALEYLTLRMLDAELKVTQETLQSRQQGLKIVQGRLDAGAGSALDLAQARAALSAAEAQANQLRRQRAVTENLLALLTGQPDLKVRVGDIERLPQPPMPPLGLPSGLLEVRPDVRQAEEKLVAANARIGVAKAAYFPSISLTGLLGSESAALSSLFGSSASIWSYGASLAMPLFNAGRTTARVDQASASQREALAQYLNTVQTAFMEVKNALVSLKEYSEEETALAAQVAAASQAHTLAEARYEAGYDGYLDVLDSQRTLNAAQLLHLTARRNHLAGTVDLFKALGGGWQPEAAD